MCWMMMPRAGGRHFKFVVKTMDAIFQRNLAAWEQDNRTFTHTPTRAKKKSKTAKRKKATPKPAKRRR